MGYVRAHELLVDRVGDDFAISEAYVKKILSGPPFKSNDVRGRQDFCDEGRQTATLHWNPESPG